MAQEMALMRAFTYITKPYSAEEWTEFRNNHQECLDFTILTSSNGDGNFEYVCDIMTAAPGIKMIHLNFDKSKGSYDEYVKMVENIRRTFPTKYVLTGITSCSQEQNTFSRGPPDNPLPYKVAVPTEIVNEQDINFVRGLFVYFAIIQSTFRLFKGQQYLNHMLRTNIDG